MTVRIHRAWPASIAILVAACGGSPETAETETRAKPPEPAAVADTTEPAPAHDHAHGNVEHPLGESAASGIVVSAVQMDDLVPGGESVFKVVFKGGDPEAVRLWVGDEAATNSTKALTEIDASSGVHAHVELPDPLGPADAFWVQMDLADGSSAKVSFALAAGTVLPPQGPRTGFVVPLAGADGSAPGFAEIKLHDDKGDLEVWLATDRGMTAPLDLAMDAAVLVEFPEMQKRVELRVRNLEGNEDEDGASMVRDGRTNYFIYPGDTGADSSWLMGDFRTSARIFVGDRSSETFTLVPHTHGSGGHSH